MISTLPTLENKIKFWDTKIAAWEDAKYSTPPGIYKYFFDVNRSVKERMNFASNVISQLGQGLTILELGCGTARLLPAILHTQPQKYIGVDFSPVVIQAAQERARLIDKNSVSSFIQGDVLEIDAIEVDFCFSLGLLDWLNLQEIARLLQRIKARYYLHSYSRKSLSFFRALHQVYVYLSYGHDLKGYIPRYYKKEDLDQLFKTHSNTSMKLFFSPRLTFGAFLHHLPASTHIK